MFLARLMTKDYGVLFLLFTSECQLRFNAVKANLLCGATLEDCIVIGL